MQKAIGNNQTRKLIVNHYNDIIQEEKNAYQETNKTMALKLVQNRLNEREYFLVNQSKKKKEETKKKRGNDESDGSHEFDTPKKKKEDDISDSLQFD